LNANIGDVNMGDIILDLGSEVNVLPKNTWQCMGEPTLGYSPVQLKLENQHKVLPIGILKGVTVDLDGVCAKADFEVIEIVDDTTPYPMLLGLDWEFENQSIINLKTRKNDISVRGIQGHHAIRPIERGKVCITYLLRLRRNKPVVQNNCT
jgi:hypothetical protein